MTTKRRILETQNSRSTQAKNQDAAHTAICGLRIKHWVVGMGVCFLGLMMSTLTKKYNLVKQISFIVFGIGTLLIVDEYEAVWRFITTGVYP